MATDYVDPNVDGAVQQWSRGGPPNGDNYTLIDDGIRQPTATGFDYKYMEGTGGQICEFGCTTLTGAGSVTSVEVWMYHYDFGDPGAYETGVQVYMGAAWQTLQNVAKRVEGWDSVTFNGTWNQADLDALQVRFIAGADGACDLEEFYCLITYTAGGPTQKILSEAIALTDSKTRKVIRMYSESMSLADSVNVAKAGIKVILNEELGLVDEMNPGADRLLTATLAEALALADFYKQPTYLVVENNELRIYVLGVEVARFKANGDLDLNGVVNINAF